MSRCHRTAAVVLLASLSGCAWARRENRPVWTAFEEHLVPESPAGFAIALPLTVPLGLLAIVTDTFVAHPLQVVDDAWRDSADLWRGFDFEKAYYTGAGTMPLRAVATPVVFVGSFLGRSCFDVRDTEDVERDRLAELAKARADTLAWLQRIAGGEDARLAGRPPSSFDAELQAALALAIGRGSALGRLRVYERAATSFAGAVDWQLALGDPSAVVRYRVLQILPGGADVPDATWQRLREDPDEAVRALAARGPPK
ncbi:MAG TPA: hypothetical protein VFZ65_10705 [Planctomycetota bacterium]|nr:hypothetical protein [Planctomycetota bacterium]